MKIEKDRFVTAAYTLSNEKGEVLDTSKGRAPLTYVQGAGMIEGFEAALEGKSPKDVCSFTVKPEEGYGERRPELLFRVDKEQLREIPELAVGVPLRVRTPDGAMVAVVAGIEDDKVLLDGNHPLAGMMLFFDVEVIDVREATEEELSEARQQEGCGCGASQQETCGCGGSCEKRCEC
jgi:FKBP-type peptidyl-prolyl cis-trans isomerase SlyD